MEQSCSYLEPSSVVSAKYACMAAMALVTPAEGYLSQTFKLGHERLTSE